MSTITTPLDPSKLKSGNWSEWWLNSGSTGSGSYYWNAPSVNIDGETTTYNENHGAWEDSNGGYSGWWWANESDLTYEGVDYDGQAIAVIDADDNSIYVCDTSIENVITKLHSDIDTSLTWFENNLMVANPTKFQVIFPGSDSTNMGLNINQKFISSSNFNLFDV